MKYFPSPELAGGLGTTIVFPESDKPMKELIETNSAVTL
jgi:hypothetical protein